MSRTSRPTTVSDGTQQADPPRGAKTLDSGLRILWELRENPDGLLHGELSRRLGIERTAVYRLIGTLQANRLVTKSDDGRYQLALGVLELASSVLPQLRRSFAQQLRELAEISQATAFVTALDGANTCVVVAVTEPSTTITHVAYRVGTRHEADRGASGIAILAGRPPVLGERAAITEARQRGYSVTSGELQTGAWGIAAPIRPPHGHPVASVGIVAIGQGDESAIAPVVLRIADVMSAGEQF
ncbi:IclR family transcriptional regulator [Actinoalloteichus hymeniacidonis]|uniref:Transcriptional regulator, IclR family n=1 Tax=Actinoalloteichus hymeniacidonis TaxID=340345 RepID=A0AAC9HTU5_9PSEU|nr:MarR family transcriptional regulator [Actinoalloteichus hymeniacidonis]AOS65358.1 transcriptional regulator, IclR family [Actinoalloteichus hymeniacidonis]MBB5906556.1 DNA-binding IclR family transcriptional regulator [Actinoalloteichus hymeniacidonis]